MLSFLFFFACRDPVRNVVIVDALIVGTCVLALTPLLSLYTLDVRRLYPAYLIWGRSVVRLAVAALLYYLRPREAVSVQRWRIIFAISKCKGLGTGRVDGIGYSAFQSCTSPHIWGQGDRLQIALAGRHGSGHLRLRFWGTRGEREFETPHPCVQSVRSHPRT